MPKGSNATRQAGLVRLGRLATTGKTPTDRARAAFYRDYVTAHPKLSYDAALSHAQKQWKTHGKPALVKERAKRAAVTRTQRQTRRYPKFTRSLIRFGVPEEKAREFSARLYTINHFYYQRRDHPEHAPTLEYREYVETHGGDEPPDEYPYYDEVSESEIKDDWLDEFYTLYEELMDEYDYDMHDNYEQET